MCFATQTEFNKKESFHCNSTPHLQKVCLEGKDSVFCNWISQFALSQMVLCERMNRGFGLNSADGLCSVTIPSIPCFPFVKFDQLRERERNFNSVAFRTGVLATQTEFNRKESSDCNSTPKLLEVYLEGEDSVFCNWISQFALS
ncbi:hypothetical protein CDAR_217551 [Caerostris darwini]|uniref:Uncharacterized protein n=1 Tax=Caerostris darwini TaxID=1538125 RepID=A0AAV4WVV0_9ARAC|nr:hypothetical protein CDAR_217551 [Caerostris darwini]